MSLKIGIVGLPNVGKSTIFNALTRSKGARVANYPFCTIDPNVGVVEVPDERLKKLAEIVNPEKIIPTVIEFVDIAGLVKGASKGEGLGNKFLSHIRECDAIAEVVRCFEDSDITHVSNKIDPKGDVETIESELILADIQTVGTRAGRSKSKAKSGDKKELEYVNLLERLESHLNEGKRANKLDLTEEEKEMIKDLHLLTDKPLMYIVNLKEDQVKTFDKEKYRETLKLHEKDEIIPICAKLEEELGELDEASALEFLKDAGLKETGLNELIKSAYKLLNFETFLTAGPKEVRAWTIKKGSSAPKAAGVIHTDFEKGFIKAEIISYEDYIKCEGEAGAKEKGLVRQEGKEYIMKDGDIVHFRFNV